MNEAASSSQKQVEDVFEEWQPYREALRKREREAYDELLEMASSKKEAMKKQGFIDPAQGIFLSMLLKQQMRIKENSGIIQELRQKTMNKK